MPHKVVICVVVIGLLSVVITQYITQPAITKCKQYDPLSIQRSELQSHNIRSAYRVLGNDLSLHLLNGELRQESLLCMAEIQSSDYPSAEISEQKHLTISNQEHVLQVKRSYVFIVIMHDERSQPLGLWPT